MIFVALAYCSEQQQQLHALQDAETMANSSMLAAWCACPAACCSVCCTVAHQAHQLTAS
jgi:hypothetical protein